MILDGWIWPEELGFPPGLDEVTAGTRTVRYPRPDPGRARHLVSLMRAARRALETRSVEDVLRSLGEVGRRLGSESRNWVPDVAGNAGLDRTMAEAVLDPIVATWSPGALERLVAAEFSDPSVLDRRVVDGPREVRALGYPVTLHLGSGSVPGVSVTSLVRGLLVKSACVVKPGAGDVALLLRFVDELRRVDPPLARAVAVQYWPGGHEAWTPWEEELFGLVDQIVTYGNDVTIEAVRRAAPARTRIVEHPHRIGVAVVGPDDLSGCADSLARAVALFDQRGCVSTHIVYVVGSRAGAEAGGEALARALEALAAALPSGTPDVARLSAVQQVRGRARMREAQGLGARVWAPAGPEWTVVLGAPGDVEPVGNRTVWVVPVEGVDALFEAVDPLRSVLQTVVLGEGCPGRATVVDGLIARGATRIVPIEQGPFPQADWLHDGARPLGELVRWSEVRR